MSYPILHRVNPPIEVVTPLGDGLANFLWGESPEALQWGVCINATGESWWFQNHRIRYGTNITLGRVRTSPIEPMPGLDPHIERNLGPVSGSAEEPRMAAVIAPWDEADLTALIHRAHRTWLASEGASAEPGSAELGDPCPSCGGRGETNCPDPFHTTCDEECKRVRGAMRSTSGGHLAGCPSIGRPSEPAAIALPEPIATESAGEDDAVTVPDVVADRRAPASRASIRDALGIYPGLTAREISDRIDCHHKRLKVELAQMKATGVLRSEGTGEIARGGRPIQRYFLIEREPSPTRVGIVPTLETERIPTDRPTWPSCARSYGTLAAISAAFAPARFSPSSPNERQPRADRGAYPGKGCHPVPYGRAGGHPGSVAAGDGRSGPGPWRRAARGRNGAYG